MQTTCPHITSSFSSILIMCTWLYVNLSVKKTNLSIKRNFCFFIWYILGLKGNPRIFKEECLLRLVIKFCYPRWRIYVLYKGEL